MFLLSRSVAAVGLLKDRLSALAICVVVYCDTASFCCGFVLSLDRFDDVLINVDCSNRFDRNDLYAGDHFWRLVVRKIESNYTRVSKVNTTLHRSPILRDYPTD